MAEPKPRIRVPAGRGRRSEPFTEKLVVDGEAMRSWMPIASDQQSVRFLPVDDIINQKGWKTYRDMRHDDQIKATLSFKKLLVHGRAVEVQPFEVDDKDSEDIAKFVEWNLQRVNFKRILREALSAFDFGFSIGELLWEVGEHDGKTAIMLKDIKHRDPENIEHVADQHGNIKRWIQEPAWGQVIELKPEKVWHYAHNSEFQNHYGRSDLRAAYKNWWSKKFIINFWNVFLERLGQPMTVAKYPLGSSEELKNTLKGILNGLSTKTEILIPEGVEIELVEATRAGNANYFEALQYHDNSIARAMLVVALLGTGGDEIKRGSDSQSRLHLRVLFKMADEIAKDLIHTFQTQVVKQLVDFNFQTEKYPRLIWQDYGEFEGIEVADTIRLLHAAGILDMNQEDVNYARSVLGLPLRREGDKEDEVVRPPQPPPPGNANAPPPAAPQGNNRTAKGQGGNRKTDPGGGERT
jgi:phage gp29-like protein